MHSLAFALVVCLAAGAAADERAVSVVFSPDEIRIIGTYYQEAATPVPRRAGRLPRGIAKNLARGKSLPPGIAKQQLPVALTSRLPPPPAGHERIVVAGKVLLVEIATQVVRDVLTDVLFR
jgi:hypothetical protein